MELIEEGKKSQNGSPRSENHTTSPSTPRYDPKTLLSPRLSKTTSKSPGKDAKPSNSLKDDEEPGGSMIGSFVEHIHGVQDRRDQPRKRMRLEEKNPDEEDKKKATFEGVGKGGVIGEYMKEKIEEGKREQGSALNAIDLTGDDDDEVITKHAEDVILVNDPGDAEVCLGRVEVARVNAHTFPRQRVGGFQGSTAFWPPLRVTFFRAPDSRNNNVAVRDARGIAFGNLDARTSLGIVPLLDNKQVQIRLQGRLEHRHRNSGEIEGHPTSQSLILDLNLYAVRKFAKSIGKHLSQKQIWLRDPKNYDRNVEYFNPQRPAASVESRTMVIASNSSGTSGMTYANRTVEEIRTDVMSVFDSLTKSEDIPTAEQDANITTPLLRHQKQALHFMTDREKDHGFAESRDSTEATENKNSLWKLRYRANGAKVYYNVITGYETRDKPPPVLGGILADMMGLGKTLSILSLVMATRSEAKDWHDSPSPAARSKRRSRATLLVSPVSTVVNWEEQINSHIRKGAITYYIYHGAARSQDVEELADHDLVITTYSTIAAEFSAKVANRKTIEKIDWFRIVLDEAHMIRNSATAQSQAICTLDAQRRWAVTGTPVQNRLDDLGALMKFLRIKPFDEKGGFTTFILAPFKNADPDIIPKLRVLVDSITLRRLKDKIDLPPRKDHIVRLDFSEDELPLYEYFEKDSASRVNMVTAGSTERLRGRSYVHILRAILRLRLICAHGSDLLNDEDMKLTEGMSSSNAIDLGDEDDQEKPVLSSKQAYDMFHLLHESDMDRCSLCSRKVGQKDLDDISDNKTDNVFGYMTPCYQIVCPDCLPRFREQVAPRTTSDNYMTCPLCEQYVRVSFFELTLTSLADDETARAKLKENPRLAKQLGRYSGPHTKTKALLARLQDNREWSAAHPTEPPLKSVVFSGWTTHLDLLEIALTEAGHVYTRLDGRMQRAVRTAALASFRDDPAVPVILVSIGAGGLGLNLTSASCVFVMEPQFNPAAEAQAVDRVHRLGQTREVLVERFVMRHSFEEKMLELQRKKERLADLSMRTGAKLGKEDAAKERLEELRSLFR